MSKYMQLLCSRCSNPESPEFRPHILEDNILTCEHCKRRIRIVRSTEARQMWLKRLLDRNAGLVPDDWVYEVEYEGD